MNSNFDIYNQPIQPKIYLGTASNKPICILNGIDDDSFSIVKNVNNTHSISFNINRFIDIDGEQVESNAYQLIDVLMRIYIDGVGWFCIDPPEVNNDGTKETKSITGESAEIEMANHDIKSLKINKGTTDSYEMLVDGNVEIIDDVEFAKEQIKFCNKTKEELSLLHILLKVSDMHGWSIGYIDDIPKIYKTYKDGELIESQVCLSDEIGTFDVDVQDLYSFLTQDVAKFFNCIFVFDFLHFTVNAYRPEHFGKNTNINIGFRNIQQSNSITVNKNDIFTRYVVSGGDDLSIIYANFGSNIIENLDYFCNEKFMPASLITKYKLWKDDVEIKRIQYIENTRLYNQQQKSISELHIRVPLDGCSMEWFTFTDDELFEAQANYTAQKKGYEQFYVDESGDFDESALRSSSDANDYYQIKDVILPSIQIEIDNRKIVDPDSDQIKDYIDSYETDWKLYGLDELQVKLDRYKNTKKVCEDGKYNVPYSSDSGHTEDMHTEMYNKYLDAKNQLDPLFHGSCQEAYNSRKQEIDEATVMLNQYDANRKDIAKVYDKTQWKNGDVYFTKQDIRTLSHLYIDNTYSNENFFLTSSDDSVSAIDEQLKLLSAAQEDLEIASQPQYIYDTSLDNFLALYEYKNYIDNFNLGDFIYLGIDDDKVVKLRIISMQYNLLEMNNELQITFSNMLRSRSKYDDFVSLLDTPNGRGKGGNSGGSNDYLDNEGITLTAGLIQKLLANGSFNNKVSQIINNEFAGYVGKLISVKDLNAELIKATDIEGANGFFEYLQSKLISSDKIIADSGIFKKLSSLVGQIDTLLSGTFSAELGHLIHLTAETVSIDEAVIKDLIAAHIMVSDLMAGDITLTDKMRILSDNGMMVMNGETLQIMGTKSDGTQYVAIQLGYSSTGKPSLIINDETGAVMLDAQGLHEAIVPDNFIKNDMLAGGITKEKLAFHVVETDENGKVNASDVTINGQGLDAKFTTIETTIEETKDSISSVELKVNNNTKAITQKASQSDIITAINDYDGSTVKTIRDQVSSHTTKIGSIESSVSDVKTELTEKADGSTVQALSNKQSKLEQDANSFKTTVSTSYATKDEVSSVQSTLTQKDKEIEGKIETTEGNVSKLTVNLQGVSTDVENNKGDISRLKTTAEEIRGDVTDAQGNITNLQATARGLETKVSQKKDASITAIRYIRDWLDGNSVDAENRWVECNVMVDDTNIAAGIIPVCKDSALNTVSISNASVYTDTYLLDDGTPEYYVSRTGKSCLELDLGSIRYDIDSIKIWHYYMDNRVYNHQLQVSKDGLTWVTLYDSKISGGYMESDAGAEYFVSDSSISGNFSSVNQTVGKIESTIHDVDGKLTQVTQKVDEWSSTATDNEELLKNLDNKIIQLNSDFAKEKSNTAKNLSDITVKVDGINQRVFKVENDITDIADIRLDANGWKALFAQLDMYDMPNVQTNISIDINGITVTNPLTGQQTKMTIDEFAGYYNDEKIFYLSQDTTMTKQVYCEKGWDTGYIKMTTNAYTLPDGRVIKGVAYVKSVGTS